MRTRSFKNLLRGSQRGQALTEFALITPLTLLLVLGGYDLSIMGTDTGLSVAAVRHAARLGAELGGSNNDNLICTGSLAPTTTLSDVDSPIIQTVLAVTKNITYLGGKGPGFAPPGKPEEIDIYHPLPTNSDGTENTDGTIDTSQDHYERYLYGSNFGTAVIPTQGAYMPKERCQGPVPYDTDIGVRLIWSYRPVNGIVGPTFTLTEYAVERFGICTDNCNPPSQDQGGQQQ